MQACEEAYVPTKELAKVLGVPTRTIRGWVAQGLPHDTAPRPHGGGPMHVFLVSEVVAWREGRKPSPEDRAKTKEELLAWSAERNRARKEKHRRKAALLVEDTIHFFGGTWFYAKDWKDVFQPTREVTKNLVDMVRPLNRALAKLDLPPLESRRQEAKGEAEYRIKKVRRALEVTRGVLGEALQDDDVV